MASLPILSDDTEALLELFNSADSGPSPHGISYWSSWIDCGRRAQLREQENASKAQQEGGQADTVDNELNYMRVGIYLHKLFEGRITRQLGGDPIWDARATAFTPNFLEAIRLYREYHRHWGSLEERWGCRVLATEMPLGGPAVAATVTARLGGPLTGRADAIIEIIDPDKARANTGLVLMPGRYIWDMKSGKAHGSGDETKFALGLQAQAYLWLDVLERGEAGALGMVFDRCVAHKDISKSKSYAAFVAYPNLDAEEILRGMVQRGLSERAAPRANPLQCVDMFGRTCWFLRTGQCRRV